MDELRTASEYVQGVKTLTILDKNRISIPTEWRHFLKPDSQVVFLNTGNYLILIPGEVFQNDSADLIHINGRIDHTGRLLLPKALFEAFNIHLEGMEVYMIGKGIHVELYTSRSNFNIAMQRSNQAAIVFQAQLINVLKKP